MRSERQYLTNERGKMKKYKSLPLELFGLSSSELKIHSDKAINLLCKEVKDISKKDGQLPFAAAICNVKTGVCFSVVNIKVTKKKNEYIYGKKLNKYSHAERWLLDEVSYQMGIKDFSDWLMFTTIPPCSNCFDHIVKFNVKAVFYLFCDDEQSKHKFDYYSAKKLNEMIYSVNEIFEYKNELIYLGAIAKAEKYYKKKTKSKNNNSRVCRKK